MSATPLPAAVPHRLPMKALLSLIDQAFVSGTNFLTTLFVARACTSADLGLHALGFTLVVLGLATQDSLAVTPFTLLAPRLPEDERPGYAAAVFVHQLLLGLACSVALGAAAGVTALAGGALAPVLAAVAVVLPAVLLREFGRRFAFSQLAPGGACAVDAVTAVVQLSGLALLAWLAALTPVSAHLAAGLACGVAGLGWLLVSWRELRFDGVRLADAWHKNLEVGRWLLATQLTSVVHGYIVHWLLAMRQGAAAAGVFAACLTVVLLTNPLLFGVSNLLAPMAARAYADEGKAGLLRVVVRTAILLLVPLGAFALAAGLYAEQALDLFYGSRYAGFGLLVFVLSLGVLLGALALPAEHGLRAAGYARQTFLCSLTSLVVTVVVATLLMGSHGLMGAGFGYFAGSLVGVLTRSWLLWRVLRPEGGGR
jgi:O-antigen/teichoic acid export membrane protein